MRLCEYMENFPWGNYAALLAGDIPRRAGKLLTVMGDISAGQYILECLVSNTGVGGDFSIQITHSELPGFLAAFDGDVLDSWCKQTTAWSRVRQLCRRWDSDPLFSSVGDIWLEFDYETFDGEIPLPCLFVNAEGLCIEDALKGPVSVMLGGKLTEGLCEYLKKCSYALSGIGMFQLGAMLGREESHRPVRLFTKEMNFDQIMPVLYKVRWGSKDDCAKLEALIDWIQDYSDGLYVLDIAVSDNGIKDKIGICFSPPPVIQPLTAFLEALEKKGWAEPEKCCDIKAWIKRNDFASLENNISHFKIPFEGEVLGVKAYLRNEPYKFPLFSPNSRW